MKQEALRWLERAVSDLGHAKRSMESGDYAWAEFASQQAAEKALKAACLAKGLGLLRTHDLTLLARNLGAPRKVLSDCGLLNAFYTVSRYPDMEALRDKALEAQAARDGVESAERVVMWCKKRLRD